MLDQLAAIRSRQAALQSQLSSTTEIASAAKKARKGKLADCS